MCEYVKKYTEELAVEKNLNVNEYTYIFHKDGSLRDVSFNNGLWFTHASGLVCKVSEESMGTQQALRIVPFLLDDDLDDVTLVFDEFGTSMHPLVLDNLVRQFQSKNATKTNQLVCVTHYTTLLTEDLFRCDEIWFVDKTEEGSEIYSLDQFENNSDGSVSEDYLTGRFGALPVFRS